MVMRAPARERGSARRGVRGGRDPVRARAPPAARRHGDRARADRAAALPARAPAATPPATLGDLLAWLRAPGLLERPELADSLEIRARRGGALSAAGRARCGRSATGPSRRSTSSPGRRAGPGGADRARGARAAVAVRGAPRAEPRACSRTQELDEARALSAGRAALAELRELARAAPELAPADGPRWRAGSSASRCSAAGGPRAGAVAVLDPLALRARRVRALFVCALQEGVFPARARPQPLLGEEERRRLAETSGLRLGEHGGSAGGRALPAVRGRLAPGGAARAQLARRRRRRRADRALAVRGRRLRPVRARRSASSACAGRSVRPSPRRPEPRTRARPRARRRCATSGVLRSCARGPGRHPRLKGGSAARCAGS